MTLDRTFALIGGDEDDEYLARSCICPLLNTASSRSTEGVETPVFLAAKILLRKKTIGTPGAKVRCCSVLTEGEVLLFSTRLCGLIFKPLRSTGAPNDNDKFIIHHLPFFLVKYIRANEYIILVPGTVIRMAVHHRAAGAHANFIGAPASACLRVPSGNSVRTASGEHLPTPDDLAQSRFGRDDARGT